MKKYIKPELETITLYGDVMCSSTDSTTIGDTPPSETTTPVDPWP